MKRIAALLLALAALTLFSCSSSAQERRITNNVLGIAFDAPEGWETVENGEIIQLRVGAREITNITVGITDPVGDVETYEAQLIADHLNCTVETRDVKKTSGSKEIRSWIYSADYQNGEEIQRLKFMQSFVTENGRTALFTLCADSALFDRYNLLLESCAAGMEFTDAVPEETASVSGKLSNDAVEYVLTCPEGWTRVRNDGMIAISAADGSGVSCCAFTMESSVNSLQEYLEKIYIPELKAVITDLERVGEYEATVTDSRWTGIVARYSGSVAGTEYGFLHKLVYRGGNVYSLLYTAAADKYDAHLDEVKKIFDGFTFVKGE